jgi:hypothetical protein
MFNLGFTQNLQTIKLNMPLVGPIAFDIETFLMEYKDIFTWNYTDLKEIPPQIV